MSGTHSESTVASAASQAEPVEKPSNLENFEREEHEIRAIFTSLSKQYQGSTTVGQRPLKADPYWARGRH